MHALAAQSSAGSTIGGVLIWLAIVLAYWAPTAVASFRHVPNTGSVIVINALLGWTVVGWIVALAMACRSKRPPQLAVMPYPPYLPPQQFPQFPPPQPPPYPAPENGR